MASGELSRIQESKVIGYIILNFSTADIRSITERNLARQLLKLYPKVNWFSYTIPVVLRPVSLVNCIHGREKDLLFRYKKPVIPKISSKDPIAKRNEKLHRTKHGHNAVIKKKIQSLIDFIML